MAGLDTTPITPITTKADRRDERVRLIEESVLLMRGDWPALTTGLCESVNRAAGLLFPSKQSLEDAIRETSRESLGLVERLYGDAAVAEVQSRAAVGRDEERDRIDESPSRRGIHLPRRRARVQARAG
jgi:hypothetical protein